MHSQRLLTAAVIGPLLFIVVWWGGKSLFSPVVAVGAVICLYEYYALTFSGRLSWQISGMVLGVLPVLAAVLWEEPAYLAVALYLGLLGSAVLFLTSYRMWPAAMERWAVFLMGICYIGLCSAHIVLLRSVPMGRELVLFFFVTILSGDAGAYYVGHAIGRHKLCREVSKGKTVEGALGGLATNGLVALLLWFLLFQSRDPWLFILLALLLGAVGQVGDLAASMVKRSVGSKDSGRLLPGHGGMLDRVDALLLAAPAFYWLLVKISWPMTDGCGSWWGIGS